MDKINKSKSGKVSRPKSGNNCNKIRVRLFVQGLTGSGRQSVLHRLKEGEFIPSDKRNLIGIEFVNLSIDGINVHAYNLQRRERTRSLYTSFYNKHDGVVCIIDSQDQSVLAEALSEMEDFFHLPDKTARAKVMLVLANKQDVEGALPVEEIEKQVREREATHGLTMARKTVFVAGCSAKTGEGLEEAFSLFLEEILKHQAASEALKPKAEEKGQEKESRFRFLQKLADIPLVKSLLFH